jgi:hypothetical protein
MAFDREAAKQAGYTDDEINAYLQAEAKKAKAPTPVTTDVGEPPAPTTSITPVETSAGGGLTQFGLAAAPYVVPAAAGAYAIKKGADALGAVNKGINAMSDIASSQQAQAQARMASEQGIAQRFEQRMAQQAGQAVRPVAPSTPTYNVPTSNMPVARPAIPTAPTAPTPLAPQAAAAGAAPEEAGILSRASDIVRRLALDKVAPGLAKAGIGAGLMAYSPDLGPKVPSVGRMKGMEINPLTGAPWTPDQIKQYEANSAMFDQQLAAPQMRR